MNYSAKRSGRTEGGDKMKWKTYGMRGLHVYVCDGMVEVEVGQLRVRFLKGLQGVSVRVSFSIRKLSVSAIVDMSW